MTPETGLIIGLILIGLAIALSVVAEIAKRKAIQAGIIKSLKKRGIIE